VLGLQDKVYISSNFVLVSLFVVTCCLRSFYVALIFAPVSFCFVFLFVLNSCLLEILLLAAWLLIQHFNKEEFIMTTALTLLQTVYCGNHVRSVIHNI